MKEKAHKLVNGLVYREEIKLTLYVEAAEFDWKKKKRRHKVINQVPGFILSPHLPFAGASEGTDCVIEDTSGVGSAESGTAISVGQGLDVQELQVGGG
jgi:hypothetical protein